MQRRDVLRAVGLGVAGATAGLAGCRGTDGDAATPTPEPVGDSAACRPPTASLADTLPQGEAFERQGDVTASEASHDDGVERTAYALYRGPDGETYYCSVTEFTSADTATDGTRRARLEGGNSNVVLGLVQFGQYVYFAAGPDSDRVRELLRASSLSEDCLAEAFQQLSGTATPKPL